MGPVEWTTEVLRVWIRASLVMSEMQSLMFLRMMQMAGGGVALPAIPAEAAAASEQVRPAA
jgi:hypothetical protein